jgi:putative ABC transport system permease protein
MRDRYETIRTGLAQDLRDGLRSLRAHSTVTLVAIVTLALGIGANASIFSLVNGVLLRPLPYAEPGRLVKIEQTTPTFGRMALRNFPTYRAESTLIESMTGYVSSARVEEGSSPERVRLVQAERSLFRVLGVQATAGRTFQEDDTADALVIAAALARRRFGGAAAAVGQSLVLEGERLTVIGVMADDFRFPFSIDGPLGAGPAEMWRLLDPPSNPRAAMDNVVARLRPGVTLAAAGAELNAIARRLSAQYPDANAGLGVALTPLDESIAGPVRPRLLVLLGAVGLVLLAACANVANLLLVRASARAREVAVRAALGAGRLRLARQFLAESLVLAFAGGAAGLVLAAWATPALAALAAFQLPQGIEVGVDWRVFLFLFGVCLATGIGFGLAPALAAARTDINGALKSGTGSPGAGFFFRRFRDLLATAEIALAFVLAIGAVLLVRELVRIRHVDPGFTTANVLTLHLLPNVGPAECADLVPRVEALPGVRAAAFAQMLPLQSWGWTATFSIPGQAPLPPAQRPTVELRYVTPHYFQALGIPITKGRAFTDADDAAAPRVVIVNESAVQKYFGSLEPVGLTTDRGVVVGVAGDVRQAGLNQPTLADFYYPIAQNMSQTRTLGMSLIVSTRVPPDTLIGPTRELIRRTHPNLAIFGVKTMRDIVRDSLAEVDLYVWLVGSFAALALVLACVGIYGVMSYSVASRAREFGVRLALGQGAASLQRLVLREAARLIVLGLGVGLAAGRLSSSLLDSLIPGAGDLRPAALAGAAAALAFVALVACLAPARRAARVDPIIALKQE